MTHRQLFRHPLGTMPGPARWYLAALAMLALLLASAHFAVQARAQLEMRGAVQRLLARHGGAAASIRYHLLRGALTLRGIRLRAGAARLRIASASLHVSTRAMASGAPEVSDVRLDGVRLSLPATTLAGWLKGRGEPAAWWAALRRADLVRLRRGVLRVERASAGQRNTPQDASGGIAPWFLRDVGGEIHPRAFELAARAGDGQVLLDGRQSDAGWRGHIRLRDLPGAWLARALGLAGAPRALVAGHIDWRRTGPQATLAGELLIPGRKDARARLQAALGAAPGRGTDAATVQINATRWPLDGWGAAWPALFGRRLQSGDWSGEATLTHGGRAWRLRIAHGRVRRLALVGEHLPEWRVEAAEIENGEVDWSRHRASLANARIRGASLGLKLDAMTAPTSPWRWRIGRLDVEDVRPELLWSHGGADTARSRLALPPLHGRLSLASSGHVQWQAESAGDEGWKLEGQGRPGRLTLRVTARQAALARLRPLLPELSLIGEQGPTRIQGAARLDVELTQGADRWRMKGEMELADVELTQGGDAFRAAHVDIPLERVDFPLVGEAAGSPPKGQPMVRALGDVRIDHWLYQAALHPIPREAQAAPAPGEWFQGLGTGWQARSITFAHGRVSIGNPDATWAEDAWLGIGRLRPGKRASLRLRARVGGGAFSAKGWMKPYARPMRLGLQARLRDALPFFLNDWLAASGAPRLVRGRLDAALDLRPRGKAQWRGAVTLALHHGATEGGAFPDDPLAALTDFDLSTLLARLDAERRAELRLHLAGDWQDSPPSLAMLGRALAERMKARAEAARLRGARPKPRAILAGLRLYRGRVFTHNERVRLRKVIRRLRAQPKLIVELTPRLGSHEPDAELVARVRRTQARIEGYMRARGIPARRIYPVWPTLEHRGGDTTGVDIVALEP